MKALTICNPYAELIARGIKRVENRKWNMRYRGPLLIHAGKGRSWLSGDKYGIPLDEMHFGFIVARCEVVACYSIAEIRKERIGCIEFPPQLKWVCSHEHAEGPWCIVLERIERLAKPIPFKGAQGLFNVPDELLESEHP